MVCPITQGDHNKQLSLFRDLKTQNTGLISVANHICPVLHFQSSHTYYVVVVERVVVQYKVVLSSEVRTRRPASADRKARRQFQATGQPVTRTQASDAMTSRLPRYEANCVQRRCLQWGVGPFAFRYQGNRATPCQYTDTTRKAIDCATTLPLIIFI